MLNSDQLGEKGESHFRELCADASLICNSSDRDRAGWDFTIDFPTPTSNHERTLDKREAALSCRVQTKTLWLNSERIVMRLSSAERLVKEPGPAFIYIMKVHDDLSSYNNYIIHVHGAFINQVLRRLRLEHSRGRKNVNDVTISFDVEKWGTVISNSGASFREAAAEAIGSMHTYIDAKKFFLDRAGYPENRLQINTTVAAGSFENLVEGFLGLRELDTVSFEVFETRFNIKLPIADVPTGSKSTLRIEPHPVDNCTIRLSKGLAHQTILHGKLYVPAILDIPRELFRLLEPV